MTRRQTIPVAEQGAYIAQSPRQTAVAAALSAEEALAEEANAAAGQEGSPHARAAGL